MRSQMAASGCSPKQFRDSANLSVSSLDRSALAAGRVWQQARIAAQAPLCEVQARRDPIGKRLHCCAEP
jgi:hypothetical protein